MNGIMQTAEKAAERRERQFQRRKGGKTATKCYTLLFSFGNANTLKKQERKKKGGQG